MPPNHARRMAAAVTTEEQRSRVYLRTVQLAPLGGQTAPVWFNQAEGLKDANDYHQLKTKLTQSHQKRAWCRVGELFALPPIGDPAEPGHLSQPGMGGRRH